MGLDMYLYRSVNMFYCKEKKEIREALSRFSTIDGERVEAIQEEVGYWRKANHIHKWFVDNVQDGTDSGRTYVVPLEALKNLLETVNTVMESIKIVDGKIEDISTASKLLPRKEGFFFGSQEYDDKYYNSLKHTKEILEKAVSYESDCDFYYRASW